MLKRYFSLFFLLIFLANCVGFSLITLIQIRIHHESTRLDRQKEIIVDLRISIKEMNSPASTFRWLEENEFTFHGHRYDVISFYNEKDVLVFRCFDDTKEETLYKKLEDHNSTSENNLPLKNKNTVLKKGNDYDHSPASFSLPLFAIVNNEGTLVVFSLSDVFRPVAFPPPWFV